MKVVVVFVVVDEVTVEVEVRKLLEVYVVGLNTWQQPALFAVVVVGPGGMGAPVPSPWVRASVNCIHG